MEWLSEIDHAMCSACPQKRADALLYLYKYEMRRRCASWSVPAESALTGECPSRLRDRSQVAGGGQGPRLGILSQAIRGALIAFFDFPHARRSFVKQTHSMAAASRWVVFLSISLFACNDQRPSAPAPVSEQPVAPVVSKAPASPAISSDAALESRLKKALAGDAVLRSSAIDVKVVDGVARVWGTVRSRAERRKVAEIIQAQAGVKSIDNNLVIVAGS